MGVPEAFLVMLAALLLIFGVVPRNRLFGFRTRYTMQSDGTEQTE